MTTSLKAYWLFWSVLAGTYVKLAVGLGLSSRRKIRDAFRALFMHANYVRFVAAAQRAEAHVARLALGEWSAFARMRGRLEDLLGTNERRNCKRRLRLWLRTAARALPLTARTLPHLAHDPTRGATCLTAGACTRPRACTAGS